MSAITHATAPTSGAPARAWATRLARLLRPAAHAAGAWVSTHARVRTADGLLWPDLLVATGAMPVDGILDECPLLVVELTSASMQRWADVPGAVVWGVTPQGPVVLADGVLTSAAAQFTVPGAPWLRLPVAQLLDVAG